MHRVVNVGGLSQGSSERLWLNSKNKEVYVLKQLAFALRITNKGGISPGPAWP